MSFRPRYSLLTLLLLTAGIAVGIKLWRGPHRMLVNSQGSLDIDIAQIFPSAKSVATTWGPLQFECEYLREWQAVNYVALLGWPDKSYGSVYLQPGQAAVSGKAYLYRVQPTPQPSETTGEKVVCWFFENERYVEQKPAFWKDQWRAYLLTNRRKIYTCEPWTAQALVCEVDVNEIEDWALRECMQRERDKLP